MIISAFYAIGGRRRERIAAAYPGLSLLIESPRVLCAFTPGGRPPLATRNQKGKSSVEPNLNTITVPGYDRWVAALE